MICRVKKFCFNLVEITVAIAIIAIGVSSIMVLFPVGLTASNEAVAENNVPDVADYMMSYLEAFTKVRGKDFISTVPEWSNTVSEPGDNGWTKVSNSNISTGNNGYFKFEQSTELPDGTTISDFTAIVRVWKELPRVYNPFAVTYTRAEDIITHASSLNISTGENPVTDIIPNDHSDKDVDDPYQSGVVYCMEISYPAEKRYELREKRIFRTEVFRNE